MTGPSGTPEKERPRVIIKRKKAKAGAHHSSAWKVAFADFMTALMIVFLALWLLGMDQETREGIASHFNDPLGRKGEPAGAVIPSPGTAPGGTLEIVPMIATRTAEKALFEEAKERIEKALMENEAFLGIRDFVDVRITEEGLVIEMVDSEESFFFESGSDVVKPRARQLFGLIASEVGRLPNPVVFEGHTDVVRFRSGASYTNWELSSDRANSVRRIMQTEGLRTSQVAEVRGYGPTELRRPTEPTHWSNRRVSILARYTDAAGAAEIEDDGR